MLEPLSLVRVSRMCCLVIMWGSESIVSTGTLKAISQFTRLMFGYIGNLREKVRPTPIRVNVRLRGRERRRCRCRGYLAS